MSASMNRVQLLGHLGQDPEVRATVSGQKVVTLSIATGESWIDKRSGERRERTEWHRVVIFADGLANIAESYLRKGSKVMVVGKLVTNKWQDRDGNDRWTTEVQLPPYTGEILLLDRKPAEQADTDPEATEGAAFSTDGTTSATSPARAKQKGRKPAMADAKTSAGSNGIGSDFDDDIPF